MATTRTYKLKKAVTKAHYRTTASGKRVRVKSYVRKSSKKRRVPVLPKPGNQGLFRSFGYHLSSPATTRRNSLRKIVRAYGRPLTMRRLNLIAVFNKNRNPELTRKIRLDMMWLATN